MCGLILFLARSSSLGTVGEFQLLVQKPNLVCTTLLRTHRQFPSISIADAGTLVFGFPAGLYQRDLRGVRACL